MIIVKVFRGENEIRGFSVCGHSDFRPRGSDIVCSAVSALSQTAIIALDQIAGITPRWTRDDGLLECMIPEGICSHLETGAMILATIILGIDNIAKQYPSHVSVIYEEV